MKELELVPVEKAPQMLAPLPLLEVSVLLRPQLEGPLQVLQLVVGWLPPVLARWVVAQAETVVG